MLVGAECILAIHRMEQISSEEGIGSLSENLMESLKPNPEVAKKVRHQKQSHPPSHLPDPNGCVTSNLVGLEKRS